MYRNGSIGRAKEHLFATSKEITQEFPGVTAYISVNKGLVTQASAAIPIVPLYMSILYKVMKEKGIHEGCIEQMYRLFHDKLLADKPQVDEDGMIRMDDWEMREDVQQEVKQAWDRINSDNLQQLADVDGYWEDFYHMFGFGIDGVDYDADVEVDKAVPSI